MTAGTVDEPLRLAARPIVAVLIPCYNESAAIGRVVRDFRAALPNALIFVYDNNSTDDTVEVARRAGANVCRSPEPPAQTRQDRTLDQHHGRAASQQTRSSARSEFPLAGLLPRE
jgi:glycosyltransferase involved in cell wall biosynthesis